MVVRPLAVARAVVVPAVMAALLLGDGAATAQTPVAKGTIVTASRGSVTARESPGGKKATKLKHGRRVRITCQTDGPPASGPSGRSTIWDRVVVGSRRLYVADALVRTSVGSGELIAKLCGAPALDPAPTPGATTGACSITSPVTQLPPFPSRAAFIKAAVPGAQESDRETQVPASVTLAQAILETGSGTIAAGANNYFGIKATAVADEDGVYQWGVNGVGCVLRKTREVIKGRSVITIGAFRAYRGLAESIEDHGARLLANDVYKGAFKYTEKPEQFARVIARYYATDPAYGDKVVSIMRSEKLTRYDVKGGAKPAKAAPADPGSTSGDPGSGGVSPG